MVFLVAGRLVANLVFAHYLLWLQVVLLLGARARESVSNCSPPQWFRGKEQGSVWQAAPQEKSFWAGPAPRSKESSCSTAWEQKESKREPNFYSLPGHITESHVTP